MISLNAKLFLPKPFLRKSRKAVGPTVISGRGLYTPNIVLSVKSIFLYFYCFGPMSKH